MRDLIDRVIKNKKRLLGIPGGRFGVSERKERKWKLGAKYFRSRRAAASAAGGILTSEQGLRDGYGPCCLRKMQEEERQKREEARLITLFDLEKEEHPL